MNARRFLLALSAAVAAFGANATLAAAQDPVGTAGCDYPLISDDPGDASIDPSGGFGVKQHAASDNLDIVSGNLVWSAGKLTADIGIANLDKTVPDPKDSQGGAYYYFFFTRPDGTVEFVKSVNRTQDGITFAYGHLQDVAIPDALPKLGGTGLFTNYTTDGTTTGKWVEGPNGHILIDVPAAVGATEGAALTDAYVNVDTIQGYDDAAGANVPVDAAPDGSDASNPNGINWTVSGCPQA